MKPIIKDKIPKNKPTYKSDNKKINKTIKKIKQYKLKYLPEYPLINIVAMRCSGKSTIASNILSSPAQRRNKFLSNTLVIAPNECSLPYYKKRYNHIKLVDRYDDELIGQYLNKTPGAIILDDCLSICKMPHNYKNLKELLQNNKNYNKMVIVIMHYPLNFNYKVDFDTVFIMAEDFKCTQKRLYDYYTNNMFQDFELFRYTIWNVTNDHGSVVIHKGKTDKFFDNVFWHRGKMKRSL
jgi:hypothetical protein